MTRMSEAVLLFLLNAAWQVTLVALLVSASDRMLRAATRYRHALWVTAFVVSVALTLGPPLRVPAAPRLSPAVSVDRDQHPANDLSTTRPPLAGAETATAPASRAGMLSLPRMSMPALALSQRLALTIAALYGLLLLCRVSALFQAWARTRTILRSARKIALSPQVAQALARCQSALGLGQVSVLSSAAVTVPMTAGSMRPVLILPHRLLRDGDADLLISAMGHEAAHIARRDYLFNLVYEFASLPLWFHPAMRLLLRRIRQTRELRCDEIVTERLLDPRIYAQSLVQLAGAALPFGRPAATITVGIADANILEERIMSILKHTPARLRRRSALLFIAALLFVVPCIAAAPFAVRVIIHQPDVATAAGQPGAVTSAPVTQSLVSQSLVSQSNDAKPAAPEALKLLTPNGEITVLTNYRPKVGDVLTASGKRLKITGIDPQGQYSAFILKESTRPGSLTAAEIGEKRELYALEQSQDPQTKVRDESQEKHEGELSNEEIKARKRREEVERAIKEKREGGWSEQELEARRKREHVELEIRAQHQAQLAQLAKIPMDQAIQIALRETPGTVVEARLIGERGGPPTYFVAILQQNSTGSETVYVLVNAVDGSTTVKGSGEKLKSKDGKQER